LRRKVIQELVKNLKLIEHIRALVYQFLRKREKLFELKREMRAYGEKKKILAYSLSRKDGKKGSMMLW